MKFSDIPTDPGIKQKLVQTIRGQRVSHAQLFYGTEGSGKLALAIAYAQLINCQRPPNPLKGAYPASQKYSPEGDLLPPEGGSSPFRGPGGETGDSGVDSCGTCASCVQYQILAHPDLHFFFPSATSRKVSSKPSSKHYTGEWREFLLKNECQVSLPLWYDWIGIENRQGTIYTEDAADINRILAYKSYESEYKVVIIWMIEKLTYAAAPKLLKILEEPPEKTLFLLISDNPDHVIPTILSRCLQVRIPRIPEQEIRDYLVKKAGCSAVEAVAASRTSGGDIRLALNKIRQTEEDPSHFTAFRDWMRLCFAGNVPELIGFANETGKTGREKQKGLLLYGLRVAGIGSSLLHGVTTPADAGNPEATFISRFSPYLTPGKLPEFYDLLNSAIFHIERNAHTPTLFLDLSLKITSLFKG